MTEPNTFADAESDAESYADPDADSEAEVPELQGQVQWPDAASRTGDASVDKVLGLLETVRGTPVSEHAGLYTALHDSLLEALDAEPGLPPAVNAKTGGDT